MQKAVLILSFFYFSFTYAGWKVDCGNYCAFNEMPNNCQGVFYQTDPNNVHTKVYSSWDKNLKGCLADRLSMGVYKLIKPNQFSCSCGLQNSSPPSKNLPLSQATKDKLKILRAQIESWTLCAPWPNDLNPSDPMRPYTHEDLRLCQEERLNGGRNTMMINAAECLPGISPYENNFCDYSGDLNNYMGHFCLFGNQQACTIVKQGQRSDGAWFRNPYMKRYPLYVKAYQPPFSRDQMLGAMAYWIKSRDKNSLKKWLKFIDNNGKTAPWGGLQLYNLCPSRPAGPMPSHLSEEEWDNLLPDDRCAVLNVTWGLIYSVAKHIGLSDNEIANINSEFLTLMKTGFLILDQSILLEANTVPAVNPFNFQIALAYSSALIRYYTGGNNNTIRTIFDRVSERTSDLSVFFHYASNNFQASEYGAHLIQKYCKPHRGLYGFWPTQGWSAIPNDSSILYRGEHFINTKFQHHGGFTYYDRINNPTGHDCLLMINTFLNNHQRTMAQCENDDPLINGACQRYAFEKPALARIPGLGYHFNSWTAQLTYVALHHLECPYGGNLVNGSYSKICAIDTGLNPNDLNKDLTYKISLNEDRFEIYYQAKRAALNFTCAYGGVRKFRRCVLVSFPKPQIRQSVKYWVDTNPAYPGVFYQQVNNQCPFGGSIGGPNCMLNGFSAGFLDPNTTYFVRRNPAYPGVYYYPKTYKEEPVVNTLQEFRTEVFDDE